MDDQPQPEVIQDCPLFTSGALSVLLSHKCIAGDQELVSSLVQSSQSIGQVISEELHGSLSVAFSAHSRDSLTLVPGLADWLAKLGHTVGECDICMSVEPADCALAERTLALGLHMAANRPGQGLSMQSYEHHGGTASVKQVLLQLPVQHLQHLHLCFHDAETDVAAVALALTRLSRLSSLTLRSASVDPLITATSSLTCLTRFMGASVGSLSCVANLPPSLVDVCLSCGVPSSGRLSEWVPLQLSHLTQCTSLGGYLVPVLTVEDALPPNLQQLEVAVRLDGMMSLIKLTHLTSLVLHDPVTPPSSKFRKVAAALNQLSQVQLHFTDPAAASDLRPWTLGWCKLPVVEVHMRVPADAPEGLTVRRQVVGLWPKVAGTLRELSCMGSASASCILEATPKQLANALAQLTGLECLTLGGLEFEPVLGDDDAAEDLQDESEIYCLYEAIASLPRLQELTMQGLPLDLARVAVLPNRPMPPTQAWRMASSLKRLYLPYCNLDDFAVVSLALSLSSLQVLNLMGNPCGDAAMPAIAAGLLELKVLTVQDTAVTDAGVAWLSKLTALEQLVVPREVSSLAARAALGRRGCAIAEAAVGV